MITPDDPGLLRYIGDGTSVADRNLPEGMTIEDVRRLWADMVLIRTFDERAVALQRQGRIGTYPPCWGEEATQCGPLAALSDDDWIFPSYRQQAIPILRGVDPATILRYRRGIGGSLGFWNPRAHRVAPICIPIATHLPHATGLAWAARMHGDDICALAWCGDGATSEGDFHEAVNIAAVTRAPVVFFVVNNGWAISTPVSRQMATESVADKAVAYGVPAVQVDGFDPIACRVATSDAVARARRGGGPTLIEAVTYRLGPHATADDPSLYRDEADVERWRPLEPVARTAAYLSRHEAIDDATADAIRDVARATVDGAVADMEATLPPGPDVLFETTYAGREPWSIAAGRAEAGER